MGVTGFNAPFQFNLYEGDGTRYHYGLVNLAAFLANAMVESIEKDSCDELNWQHTSERYALANSCGQDGRSYEDETCDIFSSDEIDDVFSCEVDPGMSAKASSTSWASSTSTGQSAPPPLQCKPGSGQGSYSGYWDASSGLLLANAPYSNDSGRTDIEGKLLY